MRKNYFMMAAFATALAFTACSNEDEIPGANNGNGSLGLDEDVIEIAISNTGVGTRAARPVGSSAADNNVNKVQLVFFEGTSVASGITFSAADGESGYSVSNGLISYETADVEEGVPGTTDRETKVARIKVSGLNADKTYTIVAYGYNGENFPYGTIAGPETGKTYYSTGTTHGKSGFGLEEVFAGTVNATTTANAGTAEQPIVKFNSSVRVELTRQVAGMLAYFKNVPATIDDKSVAKITVEANDKSSGFYFPAVTWGKEDSKSEDFNGIDDQSNTTETLLTFTIADGTEVDSDNNTYKFNTSGTDGKKYQLADGMSPISDLVCEDNTLYGGRFILPYAAHATTGDATLLVKMWAKDNDTTPLKVMKVRTNQTMQRPATALQYDIRCNNFYSIGTKLATEDTTGGEGPGEPDPENPDEPADLSASDSLTVVINDAWDVLHDMTLE